MPINSQLLRPTHYEQIDLLKLVHVRYSVDESIGAEMKGWVMPKLVPCNKESVNSLCGEKNQSQ
jgi:hypothetical protein